MAKRLTKEERAIEARLKTIIGNCINRITIPILEIPNIYKVARAHLALSDAELSAKVSEYVQTIRCS